MIVPHSLIDQGARTVHAPKQELEEGLEKERALLPSPPALAPGTRRILEQKVKEQQCDGGLVDAVGLATQKPSLESGAVGSGNCAATSALRSVLQAMGLAEQGAGSVARKGKQAATQDLRGYNFQPQVNFAQVLCWLAKL